MAKKYRINWTAANVMGSCEILEVEKRKASPTKAAKRIVLGRLV